MNCDKLEIESIIERKNTLVDLADTCIYEIFSNENSGESDSISDFEIEIK